MPCSRTRWIPEPILTSIRSLILPMSIMTTDSDPLVAFMTQHRMVHDFRESMRRVCPTGPASRNWLWPLLLQTNDPVQVMLQTLFECSDRPIPKTDYVMASGLLTESHGNHWLALALVLGHLSVYQRNLRNTVHLESLNFSLEYTKQIDTRCSREGSLCMCRELHKVPVNLH